MSIYKILKPYTMYYNDEAGQFEYDESLGFVLRAYDCLLDRRPKAQALANRLCTMLAATAEYDASTGEYLIDADLFDEVHRAIMRLTIGTDLHSNKQA